jgi:hypothetical protein
MLCHVKVKCYVVKLWRSLVEWGQGKVTLYRVVWRIGYVQLRSVMFW